MDSYFPKVVYKSVQNSVVLREHPPRLDSNVLFRRFCRFQAKIPVLEEGKLTFLLFAALIYWDSGGLRPLIPLTFAR